MKKLIKLLFIKRYIEMYHLLKWSVENEFIDKSVKEIATEKMEKLIKEL